MTDTGQEEDLFTDQRPLERRDDVLVYTTEPLADDLEVTGPITLTLYAATSTPDTDFVATLVDVQPDGLARPIVWGVQRGRYLASLSRPAALVPRRVYEWIIDLWATANVFLKGHRIRLEVSSSFFPFFGRNHNTGHPVASDAEFALAEQTIHHSMRYPSRLLLPVVGDAVDRA
jgi:putative CocE/NonD family hydrolase